MRSRCGCRRRIYNRSDFITVFITGYLLQIRHKKRIRETKGLSSYHPSLLCCADQMLAVMELSQHLVSSSKTVKTIIPGGARCMGHVKIMWYAVCLLAPHLHFAEEATSHWAWTN